MAAKFDPRSIAKPYDWQQYCKAHNYPLVIVGPSGLRIPLAEYVDVIRRARQSAPGRILAHRFFQEVLPREEFLEQMWRLIEMRINIRGNLQTYWKRDVGVFANRHHRRRTSQPLVNYET